MNTAELKSKAKDQIRGKWAVAIGTVLIANIILELDIGYKTASELGIEGLSYSLDLITLLLGGVISVGLCRFLLDMATKREEPRFNTLFSSFNIYLKTLGLNLLITLAVLSRNFIIYSSRYNSISNVFTSILYIVRGPK